MQHGNSLSRSGGSAHGSNRRLNANRRNAEQKGGFLFGGSIYVQDFEILIFGVANVPP